MVLVFLAPAGDGQIEQQEHQGDEVNSKNMRWLAEYERCVVCIILYPQENQLVESLAKPRKSEAVEHVRLFGRWIVARPSNPLLVAEQKDAVAT